MSVLSRITASMALCAVLALAAPKAQASVLVPLDTRALVTRADRIVVGVVEGQSSHWIDDSRSAIVTDVRVRVRQAMLGAREGEILTVRRLGGSVDGIGMRVFGEASYAPGEEILLFAERRGEDLYAVGMTQGKLRITEENGRKMAQADLSGASLLSLPENQRSSAPRPLARRPLSELLGEVRTLLGQLPAKAVRP